MKGETEEEENQDLVMVTAAKSTASLCLSIDRTKGGVGKKPSVCHKPELAAVGYVWKSRNLSTGECICRTRAKNICTMVVKYTASA